MKTILALLAGMGITLLIVVFVIAGDEQPPAMPAQSQEAVPMAPKQRYVKDPISGQWADWDAELKEITSLSGKPDPRGDALRDRLDASQNARLRAHEEQEQERADAIEEQLWGPGGKP